MYSSSTAEQRAERRLLRMGTERLSVHWVQRFGIVRGQKSLNSITQQCEYNYIQLKCILSIVKMDN